MSIARKIIHNLYDDLYKVEQVPEYIGSFENKTLFSDGSFLEYGEYQESVSSVSPKIKDFKYSKEEILFSTEENDYKILKNGDFLKLYEGNYILPVSKEEIKKLKKESKIDIELYKNSLNIEKPKNRISKLFKR